MHVDYWMREQAMRDLSFQGTAVKHVMANVPPGFLPILGPGFPPGSGPGFLPGSGQRVVVIAPQGLHNEGDVAHRGLVHSGMML